MNGDATPPISLILTVKNEAESLPALLESIELQSLRPTEVVVVDGGSSDSTLDVLSAWSERLPIAVVSQPEANISAGRNIAIEHSTGSIVAVTDAGVVLDPQWLAHLVATLTQSAMPTDVAAGFFEPDCRSNFEWCLAATTLPDASEVDPETFLPSSRSVAFWRSWFDAGVRYPEWLDYCEDLIFDLRLKRAGARIKFQPRAIARFRPRSDLRGFWRQYFLYSRGDGKAGLFWKRHLVRYVTYLALLPSLFLIRNPVWRLIALAGAVAYMKGPVTRLWDRSEGSLLAVALAVPVVTFLRACGDLAKMVGYPAGLLWRARRFGLRENWQSIPEDRTK